MRILTLGVYERSEEEFFDLIQHNKIDLFVDVRRVRGLRGGTYKFANSNYLQAKLAELSISYWHAKELSPAKAVRNLQHQADKAENMLKRDRSTLSPFFVKTYIQEVLQNEKLDSAATEILTQINGPKNPTICLFCVERIHTACHRSLLAEALAVKLHATVYHL
jgi:uncharacterized protein (DUF488 family)